MNEELECEFTKTSKLVLRVELHSLKDYEEWLGKHVPLPKKGKSALSGKEVWIAPAHIYMGREFNLSNAILLDEMDQANVSRYKAEDLEGVRLRDIVVKFIDPIRFHCGNFRYQAYGNVWECSGAGGGRNLYRGDDVYLKVKNVAYCNYTIYSENSFGCHGVDNCSFLINGYNCTKVTRSFEVDACSNCSGLLFCHNCENVKDSMFCFNSKNLRYAIGNIEVGLEKYMQLRDMILKQIGHELKTEKSLHYDIFNIGCRGEKLWHNKLMKP
jgi:hypothetical protein